MAGHSHAHNVAVRKGKQDAKKAVECSKASKDIMIAARAGADPNSNFQLRHAIQKAKAISLPKDRIDNAIKKGAGLLDNSKMQMVMYEGYAPGGIAIIVECLTDNLNRTIPLIRSIFDKAGGSIGTPGSVAYMFKRKGLFVFDGLGKSKEELEELLILEKEFDVTLEALGKEKFEVLCPIEEFQKVTEFLTEIFSLEVSELSMIPDLQIALSEEKMKAIFKLIETFEECEDCAHVYSNLELGNTILDF
ncbi:MAG: YebC/PmpR family DNA-binding transcriptional regulator [Planctomycetota bacterium]